MNGENNNLMRKLIKAWGLPECIKESEGNVVFKFDDNGLVNTQEKGYHCRNGDVKFCIYDIRGGKALFSMDFHKSNPTIANLRKRGVGINLELLYVHDTSLRKKGISSFYLEKLINYAIQEKVEYIYVRPNANAINFLKDSKKNSLSQRELEEFYNKRSTKEMPIELNI
ncbi:hypothetical protein [Neobacillus terrae]|uniref:hypothetical protein n=1 Tax=Neobacillus terrae TaxID=3034837 RepID=UPI00140CDC26|nr:hypothetical protein [Neobacillus terrae]NHM31278.1 hypothetical protein [Neobacillus terrae]